MKYGYLAVASAVLVGSVAAAQMPARANTNPKDVKAAVYNVEPYHTRVQFSVNHMGFTDWYGDFTGVSGTLSLDPAKVSAAKLDITIPVGSISTTNTKLDDELKSAQWLDAAQYPSIHFVSTKVASTGAGKAAITGNLTFHGVTKPITLMATFNGAGVNPLDKAYTVGFNATGVVHRSDFGVKTYVPMIGDDAVLRISAAFTLAAS